MKTKFLILFLFACLDTFGAAPLIYRAKFTFGDNPQQGDTFVVLSYTRTFVTNITDSTSQVLIGAALQNTATNMLNFLRANPYNTHILSVQNATNVVQVEGDINYVLTASVTGVWGAVVVGTDAVTQYSYNTPLGGEPSSRRIPQANNLASDLNTYATTPLAEGSSITVNLMNIASAQTATGRKVFAGATVLSNTSQIFTLGAASNILGRMIHLQAFATNQGVTFGSNSLPMFALISDAVNARPSLVSLAPDGVTPIGTPSYVPVGSNVLTAGIADQRYGFTQGTNLWEFPNTFEDLVTASGGLVVPLNANTFGVLTNFSLYAVTNLAATNWFVQGPMIGTNSDPSIKVWNSVTTVPAVTGNYGVAHKIKLQADGRFTFDNYDKDGNNQQVLIEYPATTTADMQFYFPLGSVRVRKFQADQNSAFSGQANFLTIVGIGDTNVTVPSGMSAGLIFTNATIATADPTLGAAIYAVAGALHYRTSGSGEGAGADNWLLGRAGEAIGSGANQSLTMSYAGLSFGVTPSITTPTAGTYNFEATITFIEDGSNAGDLLYAKLYNFTDSSDIAGSETQMSYLPLGGYGQIYIHSWNQTFSSSKSIIVMVQNATAARGKVLSTQTSIRYTRIH